MRFAVVGSLAIALATVSAGCSSGTGSDNAPGATASAACKRSTEKRIAIDFPFTNVPIYGTLKEKAEKEAATRGYKLTWTADDLKLDKQITNLQALVAQKVPAIITLPLEPTTIEPIAKQAMDNCTVFVTYAAQVKHEDSSLGLSNRQSGEDLAKNAVGWAKKQDFSIKALILNNDPAAAAKERMDGILDGLKKAPPGKITIVANQTATSPQDAQTIAQQLLQAHPEINMIIGFNDDWALGALQAWRNLGKSDMDPKLYVGGADGTANALKELQKNNAFRCTVGYNLAKVGAAMVDIPADILEGKTVPPIVDTPLYTLTSGNPLVAEFLKQQS